MACSLSLSKAFVDYLVAFLSFFYCLWMATVKANVLSAKWSFLNHKKQAGSKTKGCFFFFLHLNN